MSEGRPQRVKQSRISWRFMWFGYCLYKTSSSFSSFFKSESTVPNVSLLLNHSLRWFKGFLYPPSVFIYSSFPSPGKPQEIWCTAEEWEAECTRMLLRIIIKYFMSVYRVWIIALMVFNRPVAIILVFFFLNKNIYPYTNNYKAKGWSVGVFLRNYIMPKTSRY